MTFLWGEKTICCKTLTIFYLEIAPRYDAKKDLLTGVGVGGIPRCVTATIAIVMEQVGEMVGGQVSDT